MAVAGAPVRDGVDVGTYSAKGVLVDEHGSVVAEHAVPYDLGIPRPGWAERYADGVWWSSLTAITRALLAIGAVRPEEIAAVGTSAIGVTTLPLDGQGRPLRPSILYGIDTRCWREIEEIDAALGRVRRPRRAWLTAPRSSPAPPTPLRRR